MGVCWGMRVAGLWCQGPCHPVALRHGDPGTDVLIIARKQAVSIPEGTCDLFIRSP